MSFNSGAIDAALAAAVGDDPTLIAELRVAFNESARGAVAALVEARDPEGWSAAAWRLKGLAASFGAVGLMALAAEAVAAGGPDPALATRLQQMLERL